MAKLPRYIFILPLLIMFALFSVNCTFSGAGCSQTDSGFEGCFESNDLGGSVIRLNDACNSGAYGELFIGRSNDPSFRAYALNGDVKTVQSGTDTGVAELLGRLTTSATQTEKITALLAPNDTVSLIFENQPPIGPMSRCASE